MYHSRYLFFALLLALTSANRAANADSIETQSNPISDGAIVIEAGNPDRSQWSSIPWFEVDSDDAGFGVDPYRVQIAHDSTNVYVHIEMMDFTINPDEEWRIQLWVDSDLDPQTGFLNNWAIGPESLLEVDTIWDYAGTSAGEWAWTPRTSGLARDQTNPLDVAVAFPRESIGNPAAFDFFVMGQNFPDASPDDALPDTAIQVFGDFYTYDLSELGPVLQAGDANQDLQFNQLDLVQVQIAAKYLSGQPATWGQGDWDGAPGGTVSAPPPGDGRFDQLDIVAALAPAHYLTGPYAAIKPAGHAGDAQTSIRYDPRTGELAVDAPAGSQLTSINIDSAAQIFTGAPAANLGGSFDNDADGNLFKATFGSSFGSLSFGHVAQTGLSAEFIQNDLAVVGSLAGGGGLGEVDLIYVPEPSALVLVGLGLASALAQRGRSRACGRTPRL